MKKEVKYSIELFKDAYYRLQEGINSADNELSKDGVIQRFEFTFELLWKTLKIVLKDEGILCISPKHCLKEAFKFGLISDEESYLNMLEDRNLTTHIYNKEDSEKVFLRIKNEYSTIIQKLVLKLEDTSL